MNGSAAATLRLPNEPVGGQWQLRAERSVLSNYFALASGDGTDHRLAVTRLHTLPVTERDRLAAGARAAGLRLADSDLDRLLPAWKRYTALVEELRAQLVPDPTRDDA